MTEQEKFKESQGKTAEEWFINGLTLYDLEKYEDAIECFNKTLEIDPNFAQAWLFKNNIYLILGKIEKVIDYYNNIYKLDYEVCIKKGDIFFDKGKYEEAMICYDNALIIISKKFGADLSSVYYLWSKKGDIYYKLEKYEEAIDCYERAIKVYSDVVFDYNGETLFDRGLKFYNSKEYEKAIDCFNKSIEINPKLIKRLYSNNVEIDLLKRIHIIEIYQRIINYYNKKIELNPKDEKSWYKKGVILSKLDMIEEAVDCFNKVIEINPNHKKAWKNKGDLLYTLENNIIVYGKGRYNEIEICYEKASEIEIKETLNLITKYDKTLKNNPNNGDAWRKKGSLLYKLGNTEEALSCLDKALEINPEDQASWHKKATILYSIGRTEEGQKCWRKYKKLRYGY